MKTTLIYVYDALCGWCYGFSNTLLQFAQNHQAELNTTVLSGGMVIGDRVGPIGEKAPYIKTAYKDVEERTGVRFGQPFLDDVLNEGKTIFDSVPPGIAMTVFKSKSPDHHLEFAADLQKGVYHDGKAPTEMSWYGEVAGKYGLDVANFISDMEEDRFRDQTFKEFKQVQEWGINGFPTVVLYGNNKAIAIARGATSAQNLEAAYQEGLNQINSKSSG
jgi:putative protein-disulfide isomerase